MTPGGSQNVACIRQNAKVTDLPSEDDFRLAAVGYWMGIRDSSAEEANAATARGNEIVRLWRAHAVAEDHLRRLLSDESDEVRYAAAAHLGNSDAAAIDVLRELTRNPQGFVAPTAELLLMRWTHDG